MSTNAAEVIDLYLYDCDVSDELFKAMLLDAVERDIEDATGIVDALHSVKGETIIERGWAGTEAEAREYAQEWLDRYLVGAWDD